MTIIIKIKINKFLIHKCLITTSYRRMHVHANTHVSRTPTTWRFRAESDRHVALCYTVKRVHALAYGGERRIWADRNGERIWLRLRCTLWIRTERPNTAPSANTKPAVYAYTWCGVVLAGSTILLIDDVVSKENVPHFNRVFRIY